MLETKNISNHLIQLINKDLLQEGSVLNENLEKTIRQTVHMVFREGYEDCLKDVREGLIK